MSTKLYSAPYQVLYQPATVATATSASTKVFERDNIGYTIVWANGSGTPTGQFFVQVQNAITDPWDSLNFGAVISLSNNSGSHSINLNQLPYGFVRVQYVPTAGQVDLTVTVVTKKIGG